MNTVHTPVSLSSFCLFEKCDLFVSCLNHILLLLVGSDFLFTYVDILFACFVNIVFIYVDILFTSLC